MPLNKQRVRQAARDAKQARLARQAEIGATRAAEELSFPRRAFAVSFGDDTWTELQVNHVGLIAGVRSYTFLLDGVTRTLDWTNDGNWSIRGGVQNFANAFTNLTPEENYAALLDAVSA